MPLYKFSESSQPLLKRCLEASTIIDPDSIWVQQFGHLLNSNIVKNEKETEKKEDKATSSVSVDRVQQFGRFLNRNLVKNEKGNDKKEDKPTPSVSIDRKTTAITENEDVPEELFRDIIESDPVSRFDFIVENCHENPRLYSKLAKQLPVTSIDKLCDHIFQTENVDTKFLLSFYKIFLPEFLKRGHSISSIDMFLKAKKYNSEYFNYFLELIINDTDLPSQVFQQYISIIDKNEQTELMKSIVLYNISNDVFIHHLHSICLLYKNCQKTEHLQKHMLVKLSNASQKCGSDKNYGRLLLNYLQAQKSFASNLPLIEDIVNKHRSPFKKPCINAFNDLKQLQE